MVKPLSQFTLEDAAPWVGWEIRGYSDSGEPMVYDTYTGERVANPVTGDGDLNAPGGFEAARNKAAASEGMVPLSSVNLQDIATVGKIGDGQTFGGDYGAAIRHVFGPDAQVVSQDGETFIKTTPELAANPNPVAIPNTSNGWFKDFGLPAGMMAASMVLPGVVAPYIQSAIPGISQGVAKAIASGLINATGGVAQGADLAEALKSGASSALSSFATGSVLDKLPSEAPGGMTYSADAGSPNSDFNLSVTPVSDGGLGLQIPTAPALGLGGEITPVSGLDQLGSGLGPIDTGGLGLSFPSGATLAPNLDLSNILSGIPTSTDYGLVPASQNVGGTTQGVGLGGQGTSGLGLNVGDSGLLSPEVAGAAGIPYGTQSLGMQGGPTDLLSPELIAAAGGAAALGAVPGSVGQGAAEAAGLTATGGSMVQDAAKQAAAKGLISKLLDGSASADDWAKILGAVGGTALGVYGADKQADAYKSVADKYFGMGQPYRDMLQASYSPGFKPSNIAGFNEAVDSSSNSILRRLSTEGNPFDNPGGLMEANRYVTSNVALPAINTYRSQLGTFGQLGTNQAGQASMTAVGADKGVYDALGYGLGQITQPTSSIDDILKRMNGVTINTGAANNGTLRLT